MSNQTNEQTQQLPLYQCHKKVRALQIAKIEHQGKTGSRALGATLHFVEPGYAPIAIDVERRLRLFPLLMTEGAVVYEGGYYMVYEDGYVAYSPAKAFNDGYTLLDSK